MVTLGFIVEGDSEAILVKSSQFLDFLKNLKIDCSSELVINAIGKNNLYHPNGDFTKIQAKVTSWIQNLYQKGAEIIFIIIDLDGENASLQDYKSNIYSEPENVIIVAKQAIEAWYLADSETLSMFLNQTEVYVEYPESFLQPIEEIKRLNIHYNSRGVTDKKILTKAFLRLGFSLSKAAKHPNCTSAQYFETKLIELV